MPRDNISLVAYGDDPLALLAQHLLDDFASQLPDLTQAVVLLADKHAAKRFRHVLQKYANERGYAALLSPRISNIRQWVLQQHQLEQSVCTAQQRELILYHALKEHPAILGNGSPWHLTQDLLKLFDQLTINNIEISDCYADFEKRIADAYGIAGESFSALSKEATLVHTLWHAWHTQLAAENRIDSEAAYLLSLSKESANDSFLYIAGYHEFKPAEAGWIKSLLAQQRCQLYLHGQAFNPEPGNIQTEYHPDTPVSNIYHAFDKPTPSQQATGDYSDFLNACYAIGEVPFVERARQFATQTSDPVKDKVSVYLANSFEQQACAIELQVRRWLIAGKTRIGIVTENRRIARRVRALLERADVTIDDYAGWALSTTRVGAVLERLLECIEEDFDHLALLDILKSPFIFADLDSDTIKHAAYRLEHDIILHENISRGLNRYRKYIHSRRDRLKWSSEISDTLLHLLDRLQHAGDILQPLRKGQHHITHFVSALGQTLDELQITPLIEKDEAGQQLLQMIDMLAHSAQSCNIKFKWSDFRTWLGRALEQHVFTLPFQGSPVVLMGLGQSRLQTFDALIIASAEHENLPGHLAYTPFFNNAVHHQLRLSTNENQLTERFHHFRRLLESAPDILITASAENNGDDVPLSPWLDILHHFYQLAYGKTLEDKQLVALLASPENQVLNGKQQPLPTQDSQPAPGLPLDMIPKRYSPSSYQQLINCPYQFYAAQCLKLSAREEIQQALSKKDYGERLHLCLQAFHGDVSWLPGPFMTSQGNQIDTSQRENAIKLLTEISEKVFSQDIESNFEHTSWFEQWNQLIPDYVDWQIQQAKDWAVYKTESKCSYTSSGIELSGRLDRIDNHQDELSVIDYKTGGFAKTDEIMSGEKVQLPFYALLAENEFHKPVRKVSYLSISKEVKTMSEIIDDDLSGISQAIADRLDKIVNDMQQGKVLPAWGSQDICQYCQMDRLCRRQSWDM